MTCFGFYRQPDTATCKDGMSMVQRYLKESKVELIRNIKEAKNHQCKLQGMVSCVEKFTGVLDPVYSGVAKGHACPAEQEQAFSKIRFFYLQNIYFFC